MKKFYFHNGREQHGPYDLFELQACNITRDTLIWYQGLGSWVPAGDIGELHHLFNTPPAVNATPPAVPYSTPTTAQAGFNIGRFIGRNIWLFIFIGILVPASIYLYNQVNKQRIESAVESTRQTEVDVRKEIRDHITSYVTADRSDYQYRGIGGIFNLKISVNNNTNYLLDNVKVRVDYIKTDGDVWDNKIIDFNLISPNTKMTIPVENTSRGVSVRYEIISIKSTALGM